MIQYGISTQTVEQRRAVIENHPDMISVAVGAHNLVFIGRDLQMLHPRAELAELMRMCRDNGVKPEFEVCALGDLWLIDDLASKGLVEPPLHDDALLRAPRRHVVAADRRRNSCTA